MSLSPPLLLICIDQRSDNIDVFRNAAFFGVNVLAADQSDLSNRVFAAKIEDRFNGISWFKTDNGTPMLNGTLSRFDCALNAIHSAGDHDILIGEIIGLTVDDGRLWDISAANMVALMKPDTPLAIIGDGLAGAMLVI